MKKLFTLIAAALMAVTANAKEAIDLSSVAPDGTITFTGACNGKESTIPQLTMLATLTMPTKVPINMCWSSTAAVPAAM